MSKLCPCGSGEELERCCGPLLAGTNPATSPEALMRSRYTAHVVADVDYVIRTTLPEQQAELDRSAVLEWATGSTWLGLEVLEVEGGSGGEGFVEFRAVFESGGSRQEHRERSRFEQRDGLWYFDASASHKSEGAAPRPPRVGRNEPCPCGSGKKYKKCCGS